MLILGRYLEDSGIEIERYLQPSERLATVAQPIGFAAWRAQLQPRTEAEIRRVFDPEDPEPKAERLMKRMEEKASTGRFVGVIAVKAGQEVGYAWAADDVSGTPARKIIKRLRGRRPYAWVAQINILPEHQSSGIGSALLAEVLDDFDNRQKPTAYVFDENPKALRWFNKRGFKPAPDAPAEKNVYFGAGAKPVQQWRLQAASTSAAKELTLVEAYNHLDSECHPPLGER